MIVPPLLLLAAGRRRRRRSCVIVETLDLKIRGLEVIALDKGGNAPSKQ